MSSLQIESSHFDLKVSMRIEHIPSNPRVKVLDVYSANGDIWNTIQKKIPEKKFQITRLEQRKDCAGVYLRGDNRKFIQSLPIEQYDIIDFDSYGCCYPSLSLIAERISVHTVCFFTQIQVQKNFGGMNTGLLYSLGYTKAMLFKTKSIFSKNGNKKFIDYLSSVNFKNAIIYQGQNREQGKWYIVGKKGKI